MNSLKTEQKLHKNTGSHSEASGIASKVASVDWQKVSAELDEYGYSIMPHQLTTVQCSAMTALYEEDIYRSRVVMERYNFGRGEYKYFSYPLPDLVAELRTTLYPRLVPIANRWHEAMKMTSRFPPKHEDFVSRCHEAGQTRPTPLMLRYKQDDYCCLHQDLYGEHVFPLQVVFLLSDPVMDFTGGELMLTELDTKRATRAELIRLNQGDAVVFAVNSRPVSGQRGFHRANMRHGVSRLHQGHRNTLGIIFHDAA
jgi:hypothetical protein